MRNSYKKYADSPIVQILISMLKAYNIKDIVISPGTRNFAFVHSVENDDYFNCYSIVDERGAAYFAIGLSIQKEVPVVLCCTSATAAVNYSSGLQEAKFQKLPIIALTADKPRFYLGQNESQMIDQVDMYREAVKKSVNLPQIHNEKEFRYCYRLVNEALLELEHNEKGPIQINYPIDSFDLGNFNIDSIWDLERIYRISYNDNIMWEKSIEKLANYNKILIIYGQNRPINKYEEEIIEKFYQNNECVIAVDYTSNLECKGTFSICKLAKFMNQDVFDEIAPDLVISMGGNYISNIKTLLRTTQLKFDHWVVNESGRLIDEFGRLTNVFECKPIEFFARLNSKITQKKVTHQYWNKLNEKLVLIEAPEFEYSGMYITQKFIESIPENSYLHLGIMMSVVWAQYYTKKKGIVTYSNNGTSSIDGSLSVFMGQAFATERLCYMLIGDLSFFYDMNAIWNRHKKNNLRILINNNGGGCTFFSNADREKQSHQEISAKVGKYVAAEHSSSVKEWVESQGFLYLCAKNKQEFDENIYEFMKKKSDRSIVFEVFTDKEKDSKIWYQYMERQIKILDNAREGQNREKIIMHIKDKQELVYKAQANYIVCRDLLKLQFINKSISKYFYDKGYRSIAIYGLGDIGKIVSNILEQENFNVSYGIDKNINIEGVKFSVYTIEDKLPSIDLIIVCVPYEFENIKRVLGHRVSYPIVSIEELITYVQQI